MIGNHPPSTTIGVRDSGYVCLSAYEGLSADEAARYRDALGRYVGDVEVFLREAWGRLPWLNSGGRAPADLLKITDVDHLVSETLLRWPAFRLVKHGEQIDRSTYTRSTVLAWTQLDDVIDPGRVFALFNQGATIVLQGLQRYWPPLMHLCRDLEFLFTYPVSCNAYITPPRSAGLGVHYDTHDVLVVQTHGRKQWEVYERLIDHPLPWQRFNSEHFVPGHDEQKPQLAAELKTGDCLYVPGGYLHKAVSVDEVSIHVTVGISPYTWSDVLWELLHDAFDDPEFRNPLPVGFANQPARLAEQIDGHLKLLGFWLDTVDPGKLATRISTRFWTTRPAMLSGQLERLASLETLNDNTLVKRRPSTIARLESPSNTSERLNVLLGDRRLGLPAHTEPTMRFILEQSTFHVRDLATFLDPQSRLLLVRRLVCEGLLENIST